MDFFERERAEIAAALANAQPCPVCGSKPQRVGNWQVKCGRCGLVGPTHYRIEGAVKRWNRLQYGEVGE